MQRGRGRYQSRGTGYSDSRQRGASGEETAHSQPEDEAQAMQEVEPVKFIHGRIKMVQLPRNERILVECTAIVTAEAVVADLSDRATDAGKQDTWLASVK